MGDREAGRIGGLDGLRAVAVLAVVAFHLWPDALPAGFLGVDLFMVLSGFLITGLLVDERARSGAVRLGAFWARRFRRLVPALLALVAVVAVWVDVAGPAALKPTVRGQGIASLLYVGNWKLVADGTSYAALMKPPSPLLHLWSLAIEEQFYLLWPLAVGAVLLLGKGRKGPLLVLAGAGTVASAALMAVWFDPHRDPLRLYYGTDTRAQAFLVGALALLASRHVDPARWRRLVRSASLPAFALLLASFLTLDAAGTLYRGGFLVFAALSAIAVLAVTLPGPLADLLDREPLRLIGRVSYGIYLWHWPVIVMVREDTAPVRGLPLLALRLVLIAGATAISWLLIEQPYRRAPRLVAARLAPAGMLLAALPVLLLPGTPVVAYADADLDHIPPPRVVEASTSTTTTATRPATPTTRATPFTSPAPPFAPGPPSDLRAPVALSFPAGTPPRSVFLIGDSGAFDMEPALEAGFSAEGSEVVSVAYAIIGLTRPEGIRASWAEAIERFRPDLFIVSLGTWDDDFIAEHGAAAYQDVVDETVRMLTAHGAHVLWLSILPSDEAMPDGRAKPDVQERIFEALPRRFPGQVDFVDISGPFVAPDGSTPRMLGGRLLRKPDRWHLCADGAAAVAHVVLGRLGLDGDSWEPGPWRDDPRFHNPPGGCPP
jgi:peptidoglycan/LPS O-acetylase OafA/YrhL